MMKELILLHGALGSTTVFDKLLPALAEQYKIYMFNLSGHGNTPFSESGFGMEVFAEELDAFMLSNNLQKPLIFGYSMGGYVALHLESTKSGRFKKIITLGTKFAWSPDTAKHETRKLNPEIIEKKVPAFAQMLAKRHTDWKKLMQVTAQMMLELGDNPLLTNQRFNAIQTPVRIMLGDQDQMVTEEESQNAANALPKGSFTTLKDTPHPIEKVDVQLIVALING